MGDSDASRSVYSLPTITETETSNVVNSEGALEEPCSSKQSVPRFVEKCTASEKPGSESLKTLQQINCIEKKNKKASIWKWSREGRFNPLLTCGNEKGSYVFAEEMLKLATFAKVFVTGPEDPLEKKTFFLLHVLQEEHFNENAWFLRIKAPLLKRL